MFKSCVSKFWKLYIKESFVITEVYQLFYLPWTCLSSMGDFVQFVSLSFKIAVVTLYLVFIFYIRYLFAFLYLLFLEVHARGKNKSAKSLPSLASLSVLLRPFFTPQIIAEMSSSVVQNKL